VSERVSVFDPRLTEAQLLWMRATGKPVMRKMATEVLALRDFVDRYRKTWTGAHGVCRVAMTAECLVCEADRMLGGETR
jgi:hypothetical protein